MLQIERMAAENALERTLAGMDIDSTPWRIVGLVISHIVLAFLTVLSFTFIEDATSIGTVGFIVILILTFPLSFLLSLGVFGGWPPDWKFWRRALIASGLLSPFSLVAWLAIYVNIFGYHG